MNTEIERKFLVKGDFKDDVIKSYKILQGFLSSVPERTVRIRISNNKGYITVKGIGNKTGTTRFEWEKELTLEEATQLFELTEANRIEKIRHIIPSANNLFFEVDVFLGKNEGLVIAEIELPTEDFSFEKPSWLGKEVTGISKYYNASLVKNPYCNW
ncbi:CYTH domain-containing protein [Lutibacter sp.]